MTTIADLEITSMQKAHLCRVCELERQCFSQPWSYQGLAYELENPTARFFVAQAQERLLGYAGMYHVADEGYLANLAVSPEYRRRGVGKRLLERLIALAREENLAFLSLEVRASNSAAISMYAAQGFKKAGVRKNFYQSPTEDALIMTRTFAKTHA